MITKIRLWLTSLLGKIRWDFWYTWRGKPYYSLIEEDHDKIKELLNPDYYIILTWRKTHLSSYAIALGHWIRTGRWGNWAHTLMNVDEGNCVNDEDFKLLEAIGVGVKFSTFMEVFDCDRVCLLAPRNMSTEEWTQVIDKYLEQEGKEYDSLLDLTDDSKVSCVESVRTALQILPDYNEKFRDFETMIRTIGNLTPDLFYECPDFKIIYEVRRA